MGDPDATRYLFSLQGRGMKFGLRNISSLLHFAGNPQKQFPSVHIAGTNGKGSSSSFFASIAMEAGYKTGLYTSPHLVSFSERIRVNGHPIPDDRLSRYVRYFKPAIDRVGATFFEATTCIAFQYFADEEVELAVIEAGLGGRLDATNVLHPVVTIITCISLDHTDILGKSVRAIAAEKAGILKSGVPCVTGVTNSAVLKVLSLKAQKQHTSLYQSHEVLKMEVLRDVEQAVRVRLYGKRLRVPGVLLGLRGIHQSLNAHVVSAALEVLLRSRHPAVVRVNSRSLKRGLQRVVANTGLRGRLERIGLDGKVLIDVAHNPDAIETLVTTLRQDGAGPFIVVFGVMKDKDYRSMIKALKSVAGMFVTVQPATPRALPEPMLRKEIRRQGVLVRRGGTVKAGLRLAKGLSKKEQKILVVGSHFVAGEALAFLETDRT